MGEKFLYVKINHSVIKVH